MKTRIKHLSFGATCNTLSVERKVFNNESTGQLKLVRLPSSEDYSRVLKRLELVINNVNYEQRLLILKPDKPLDIFLEENRGQLIHTIPFGHQSPMRVKISRNYGRVRTFISKKIPEPNEEVYEDITTNDVIEISSFDGVFKIQRVALYIKAQSDTNFTINVRYGVSSFKYRNCETVKTYRQISNCRGNLEEDSLDAKIKAQKIKEKTNMPTRQKFSSCGNLQTIKQMAVTDRFKTTSKKHIFDTSNRLKFNNTPNLQRNIYEPRLKFGKIEGLLLQNRKSAGSQQKHLSQSLIKFLCIIKTANILYSKLKNPIMFNKATPLKNPKNQQAIENIFKSWSKFLNIKTILLKSKTHMILYKNLTLPIVKKQTQIEIYDHLHGLYIFSKPAKQFRLFFLKGKT